MKTLSAQSAAKFVKGKLLTVDCTASPGAMVNVTAYGKPLTLYVRDTAHVVVIGPDSFSCKWSEVQVAVNYRETGDGAGELVSIELQ